MRRCCLFATVAVFAGCFPPPPSRAPERAHAVFDVPRVEAITIDGKADDWGDRGFRVEVLHADGTRPPTSDFDATARLGWDEKGLLVLVNVSDDVAFEQKQDSALWRRDSVELFLAAAHGSPDHWQCTVAPGLAEEHPNLRSEVNDQRKAASLKATPLAPELARSRTGRGYVLEARLPWPTVGVRPALVGEAAFQLYVTDADGPGDRVQLRWFPEGNAHRDSTRMQRLRLAAEPGPPVVAVASGAYERFRRTRVRVAARSGKRATVRAHGKPLGSCALVADGALRVGAVSLPMPPSGKPYGPLAVAIDGRHAATVDLPDPDAARQRAFEQAELRFAPFVFSGQAFPPVDFEHPSLVEDAVGPYTIETAFYDAERNQVTVARRPGRYGAIVEVATESEKTMKRFFTLYRQPKELSWWRHELPVTVEMPPELGIDPAVVQAYSREVADRMKWAMVSSFSRDADSAILLAGLNETKPGTPATDRTGPSARNDWWWHRLKKTTGDLVPLRYLVHLPPGAKAGEAKRWPTILFLHGAGERGDDLKLVGIHGPPKIVKTRTDFPFIVISPQCPKGEWWTPPRLSDLLDEATSKYPIDPDRLYLTGLSMGGYGSWRLACEYPGRFAAVVPICGGGDPRDVARINDVPIWAFHGAKDGVVPVSRSEEMVAALRKSGGRVRLTVYPDANHDSWTATYDNPALCDWLLEQRRGRPREPRATTQGTQPSH